MLIHLVRHASHDEVGRVLSGRSAISINAAGRAEAAGAAERLAARSIAAVWTSPRERARQTAAIVAAPHGLEPTIAEALDEIEFGEWTGQRFAALDADPRWFDWNARRGSACAPGGETLAEAAARAFDFVRQLEGEAVCVSHCDVIRGVVARAIGLNLDHLLRFDCDPASVTTLSIEGDAIRLVALNLR
ncbi:histidine phosphatase family protein [Sphingomonas spermidinifaciens]|uniref:Histidine phosphatase family protein n=1 Tax=Sphingomonas spermidinifaciens TaxID=1141889 RepID=A0A2A4B2S6_9SPHN|nr:histidine phosphatase family protein [Sphingomonas spermidinifaciens]PCD03503.1 histidine phosphatase family protein [Sphingomonas spermidinifaciens]